jgi:ABC-type nitrate/sulfonate/bicarbonate transport system substrate-binding protein
MTIEKYLGAAIMLALLTVGGLAPAHAADKVTIAQTSNALGFSPDFIALDEGFFQKNGIEPEITIVTGGDAATLPAVRTGSAQFGAMTLVPALQAVARGETLRVVSPLVREFVVQVVMSQAARKKSGVTDTMPLKEKYTRIKGMTVGTLDIGGGLQLVFNGFAKKYGFSPDADFNLTAIKSYPALLLAAKQGQIDVALTAIPYGTIGVTEEGLTWFADFWGGAVPETDGTHFQGVVTTADFAAKNPDLVTRMNKAYDETLLFMKEHPEKAIADIHKRFSNYSEDLLKIYYVDDKNSFAKRGIFERHGFELLRDFVAQNLIAAAKDVKYETFVLPVAREK